MAMTGEAAIRTARTVLALLALSALPAGVWAATAPRSFYDDFPGFGRHWVSVDGPYNEHLVRDFGALNLALGLVAVAAAVWLSRWMVVTVAVAWLAYSLPHLTYHVLNLEPHDTADQIGVVAGLVVGPVLAGVLLVAAPALAGRGDR